MSYQQLWRQLVPLYGDGEAKAIARLVYEVRYGLSLADILMGRDADVPAQEMETISQRLTAGEPVQYVLGQATFCGRTFAVSPAVLIPRPETEELCRWIIESEKESSAPHGLNILDIGTGSGCIAITLAAELPQAQVTGWDISAEALQVAQANALHTNVHVSWQQVDVLRAATDSTALPREESPRPSTIVSNPPYICDKERALMAPNVLLHEPHGALFVPDESPLLFYRAIATLAAEWLQPQGWLYFELNPLYAADVERLLAALHFSHIELRADQFGKQRFIRAQR